MLYAGLPDSAASKREGDPEPEWGPIEELLAQVVEEVSVLTADRRRKEPRSIPRPGDDRAAKKRPQQGVVTTENGGIQATGHLGMLAAAQMRGAVRIG